MWVVRKGQSSGDVWKMTQMAFNDVLMSLGDAWEAIECCHLA